jgi:hypothetical protein
MRSDAMNSCHACTKRTVNGSLTCDGCRDKGHRDLNCVECRQANTKVISIANGK